MSTENLNTFNGNMVNFRRDNKLIPTLRLDNKKNTDKMRNSMQSVSGSFIDSRM